MIFINEYILEVLLRVRMKRKEASVIFTAHIKELQESKMKEKQSKVLLKYTPREGLATQER